MARVHLEVTGRVQGVGFRWFVRERARRLGLAGWVRNQEDGSVEIVAEGDDAAIDMLGTALRAGPPGSSVENVRSLSSDVEEALPQPFTIRR